MPHRTNIGIANSYFRNKSEDYGFGENGHENMEKQGKNYKKDMSSTPSAQVN